MRDPYRLTAELLGTGHRLWSSVKCYVQRDRIVVYARLGPHAQADVHGALVTSEHVFRSVLGGRLEGRGWLATVHWGDRLSKTFLP